MVVAYSYTKVFFCGVLLLFLRKVETCFRFPGLPVGRSPPLLRLHHVGHPDDHREEATRRRRLHRPLRRPLHRLHPGLQEGHHHPHSEGNQLVILLMICRHQYFHLGAPGIIPVGSSLFREYLALQNCLMTEKNNFSWLAHRKQGWLGL